MPALTFRNALPADAARCFDIEISAYEGDEAATLEKIATRIAQYPQGFLILEAAGEVVGFTLGAGTSCSVRRRIPSRAKPMRTGCSVKP